MLRVVALSALVLSSCAASQAEAPAPVEPAPAPSEIEPVAGHLNRWDAIVSFDAQARALPGSPNFAEAHATALRTLAVAVEQMGERGDASRMRAAADRVAVDDDPDAIKNALFFALTAADDIELKQGRAAAGLARARAAIRVIDDAANPMERRAAIEIAFQRVAEVYVGMIQGR